VVNADSQLEDAGCPLLRVPDTRIALGALAAYWRSRFDIPLVAITAAMARPR